MNFLGVSLSRLVSKPLIALIVWQFGALLGIQTTCLSQTNQAVDSTIRDYVATPDDSFVYRVKQSQEIGDSQVAELIVTSQTWKEQVWQHQLFVICPNGVDAEQSTAMFVIGGGSWSESLAESTDASASRRARPYVAIAEQLRSPVVVMLQIPFQPMLGDRYEDDLIAHTFQQFVVTGDTEWPLLVPMVNAAVRGMDVAQEFLSQQHELDIRGFTVTGASKRGWTTWLTSAVDDRVIALAPMVIDVLNMVPQMNHQKEAWGSYSEEIGDYTARGLQLLLESEPGERLRRIVDPYSYLEDIEQPKLVILGTNDAYWPIDALQFYWDDLVGEKHVLYVPNAGHSIDDLPRILGGLNALHLAASGTRAMPNWDWRFEQDGSAQRIQITTEEEPEQVTIWYAVADERDFREASWESLTLEAEDGVFAFTQVPAINQYVAFFGEATFMRGSLPLFLSTNVRVLEPSVPR